MQKPCTNVFPNQNKTTLTNSDMKIKTKIRDTRAVFTVKEGSAGMLRSDAREIAGQGASAWRPGRDFAQPFPVSVVVNNAGEI